MEQISNVFTVLFTLLMLVLVLVLAYFTTRWIGKRATMQGMVGGGSGSIRVLDKMMMGQDRALVVVEVASRTLLLGVTQHHVELVCELDSSQLPAPPQNEGPPRFPGAFMDVLKKNLGFGFHKDDKEETPQ